MLSDLTPIATLPSTDLNRSRKFYEDTLGLAEQSEEIGGIFFRCGDGSVFVYQSQFAGSNRATAITFATADAKRFDQEVDALRKKGISFMTFDYEGMEWEGEVAVYGDRMKAVWFSDPDGNIINLGYMPTP